MGFNSYAIKANEWEAGLSRGPWDSKSGLFGRGQGGFPILWASLSTRFFWPSFVQWRSLIFSLPLLSGRGERRSMSYVHGITKTSNASARGSMVPVPNRSTLLLKMSTSWILHYRHRRLKMLGWRDHCPWSWQWQLRKSAFRMSTFRMWAAEIAGQRIFFPPRRWSALLLLRLPNS